MKQPITFAHRNVVFGRDLRDAWGLYRIETTSYDGLTNAEKKDLLGAVAAFAYGIEADFQLLRVTRPWSADRYLRGAQEMLDRRHGHLGEWEGYLARHHRALGQREVATPEVYVAIRLCPPDPSMVEQFARLLGSGATEIAAQAKRWAGAGDARGISEKGLEAILSEETKAFARATDYLDCERASTLDLQWLVRRAFCRGAGEPEVDERFSPQALVFEDEQDEVRYEPLEHDLLRLFESPLEIRARSLRADSECGTAYQATLVVGALPEATAFPGRQAELLFAPLEALDFPVDACVCARYVRNDQALALVRKRIIDADNAYAEEAISDHGPSSSTSYRPQAARELEEYLTSGSHPPLLRGTVSLAVGAPSEEELEERVERLRREYGGIKLHRPLGDQLRLFVQHLPAQRAQVSGYDDYLTVEQLGAMVPTATHAVGSDRGPYIAYTLSGSRQPVLFDLTEGSRTNRPPSILCVGTLGSGKTVLMQLMLYQAFLCGSRVVDIDPKGQGDHNLHRLPGMEGCVEEIELSSDERYRGMLDPLRVGLPGMAEDLATSFLIDVLPDPVEPGWQTEIRGAVRETMERLGERGASCGAVIDALEGGTQEAKGAARALSIYADTGLARLGFADSGAEPERAGGAQVTMLGIRNLARPLPGTPRSELSEEERIGQAVLRLLTAYAMRLVGFDRDRHAALGFDEAWFLLGDPAGRRLIEVLNRMGRSLYTTPILASQTLGEAEDLENLIGARFAFGMDSEREASRALSLLGLDGSDERLRSQLAAYRRGRALMRDYTGRVASIQVDVVDPELLAALDTTPVPAARGEGSEETVEALG